MRSSPGFSDKSVRPSFLRTTAVKKPRTEWGCQPVAFMIVAIVVPWGSLSKASTASCLVPLAAEAEGMRSGFADLFATLLARAILVFVRVLLCDIGGSFSGLRHSAPSPPKPRISAIASRAGSRRSQNRPLSRHGDSDALFAAEVHTFLRQNWRDALTNQRVQGSSPCAHTIEIK